MRNWLDWWLRLWSLSSTSRSMKNTFPPVLLDRNPQGVIAEWQLKNIRCYYLLIMTKCYHLSKNIKHYRLLTKRRLHHLLINMRCYRLLTKIRRHCLSTMRLVLTVDPLSHNRFLTTVILKRTWPNQAQPWRGRRKETNSVEEDTTPNRRASIWQKRLLLRTDGLKRLHAENSKRKTLYAT